MAYSIDIYDKTGKVVSAFALDEKLFADDLINQNLMHEYYILQTSNARINIAQTKWKWEIHGTGKKMYKQKGTWWARAGMKSSPIRRWGWVAFGPRWNENFVKSMTKKSRRLALNSIISLKAKDNELMGLKDFTLSAPKTKEAQSILKNLWVQKNKVLFVLSQNDENIIKSFRNLDNVKYLLVNYLNPQDLLSHSKIVFLESALKTLNKNKDMSLWAV